MMRVLLELGADPFLTNAKGTTPLMAAAGFGTSSPLEEAGTAMHGAAFAHFPGVAELLAESGADPRVWSAPNERGLTPLLIAEGYRGVGFNRSRPTMDMITRLMLLEGLPIDGPRPQVRDIYEKPPEPAKPGP